MKKPLIILIFTLLTFSAFGQSVMYNGLSHEYQADPQRTASEHGPMNSGWQWEKGDFGGLFGTLSEISNEGNRPSLETSIQSSLPSLQSTHSSPSAIPTLDSRIQNKAFSDSPFIASHGLWPYFEQNSSLQSQQSSDTPWQFDKPKGTFEPIEPVVVGREDEAVHNNPGIVVQGEPNPAVVAKEDEHSNLIADEEKNRVNRKYVE